MDSAAQSGDSAATAQNTSQSKGLYSPRNVPVPSQDSSVSSELRRLRQELYDVRAQIEVHTVEAHSRPLPNVVGWLQAQWQLVPGPIKGVILTYLCAFLITSFVSLLRTLRRQVKMPPPTAWPT